MKHTLIIFALLTATIQTFAQSPRIKLNQITKDSLSGSVLISSPTDSGMVYSRDLFISYGADTVLILGGDTLAATSSIISSVLSDGVTITGDGTTGSELTVDTATVIATKQDLDLYYLDSNPDGYTSNTGTVTSVGGTGTVNGISLSGTVTSSGNLTLGGTLSGVDLTSQVTGTLPIANGGTGSISQNFVDLSTNQTVGGAKTFTSALTQSGGDVNFDSGTLFVDESADRVGIGTTSPTSTLDVRGNINQAGTGNVNNVFESTSSTGRIIQSYSNDVGSAFQQGIFGSNNSQTLFGRTDNRIAFMYTTTFITQFPSVFVIGTFNNQDLVLGTNNTERLTIAANGDVSLDAYGAITDLRLDANGKFFDGASDLRLKNSINDLKFGLNEVMLLKPKEFWRNDVNQNYDLKEVGFIAQDVRSVIPNAVVNSNNGFLQLRTDAILATSVKAIQEQQSIIETQATEIETLKSQIQLILTEIEQIKNN